MHPCAIRENKIRKRKVRFIPTACRFLTSCGRSHDESWSRPLMVTQLRRFCSELTIILKNPVCQKGLMCWKCSLFPTPALASVVDAPRFARYCGIRRPLPPVSVAYWVVGPFCRLLWEWSPRSAAVYTAYTHCLD